MANNKRFIARNGLQSGSTLYVSPDGTQQVNVSLDNAGTLTFVDNLSNEIFRINDSTSGSQFVISDAAGNDSIKVLDNGTIQLAPVTGNVLVGTATDNGTDQLQVAGSVTATRYTSTVATGTAPFTVASTTLVTNLNADLLDGQTGNYYREWANVLNKPDPTLTLSGNATGSTTFTDLTNATLSVTVTGGNADTLDSLNSTQFVRSDTTGTIDAGLNTTLTILSDDGGESVLNLVGPSAGTGRLYVGQSATFGGGIEYNGDNIPVSTGAGADFITLFRRNNGTNEWTARNLYSNNNWEFRGTVTAPTFSGSFTGNLSGNATTADRWSTTRTLSLTGAVTGSVSIDGSGNVSLATTATSDPTLTLTGDATGSATFTNLGNASLTVSVAQAGNANTLDNLDSTAFLRSNADDTGTGNYIFNGTEGISVRRGIDGGYGTSNGTGTNWGTPIWSMGNAYNGTGQGTTFSIDASQYGVTWLRDTHPSVTSSIVNEGLYLWRAGNKIAGFGYSGHWFSGNVRATGDVIAFYSDERLKDFHGTITGAVDKVKSLNGYYFTENETAKALGYTNDQMQLGVSAQEVQKVFPEAVAKAAISYKEGVDEEYLTVKYEKLVPVLIEAIKEQQTQIDELTKKVNMLLDAASK